jgi:hypothetical protein
MSTFQIRRFSKPEMLRGIAKPHLLSFLRGYGGYFAEQGLVLPDEDAGELNYPRLSEILLSPGPSTPPQLAEALFYINEIATAEGFDDLQAAIAEAKLDLDLGEEVTPADLAIQVWMREPRIIEKVHAEQRFLKARSFVYFKTNLPEVPPWISPTDATLAQLESAVDGWFVKKRRGQYCKVYLYQKSGHIWFLVRHGKPYTREAVIEAGESAAQFFRPEKFDVLAYNPATGELRINAETQGERQLYREEFGLHLFGDRAFFGRTRCFDLEPLRQLGEDALLCSDVDGIDTVILRSVEIYRGGSQKETEIRRAEDLFVSFKDGQKSFPQGGRIVRATFLIHFSNSKTPRTVTVDAGNRAQFKRDGDAEIIERWLALRGFIL